MVTEIGRSSSTGTGEVGQGFRTPDDGDIVLNGHGLPNRTSIHVEDSNAWKRVKFSFPISNGTSRIGVFYASIKRGLNLVTIPIIKMSKTGKT